MTVVLEIDSIRGQICPQILQKLVISRDLMASSFNYTDKLEVVYLKVSDLTFDANFTS